MLAVPRVSSNIDNGSKSPKNKKKTAVRQKVKRNSVLTENDDGGKNETTENCNTEWASAMSKLLVVKPPKVDPKCPILASAHQEDDTTSPKAKKAKQSILVVGEDDKPIDIIDADQEESQPRSRNRDRRDWEQMGKMKPDITDKDYERTLSRIATRGVMHLFNAVQARQKAIESKLKEVGTSEFKKDKVLKSMTKGDFLDILKNNTSNVGTKEHKQEPRMEPKWKLLHDDFTTGSKMKDWDIKSSSSESE